MPESYTPIAFIEGTVAVHATFMGEERPVVHILARRINESDAEANARNTVYASGDPQRYKLILAPGQWHAWAELGIVKSQPITVELKEGGTERINFVFGKP